MHPLLDPASYTYSSYAVPVAMVAVFALGVGLWVVWHERARRISLSFLAVSLAGSIYLGGFALMLVSAQHEVALFWGRFLYVGVPFIVPAVYQFSMDLLGLRERRIRWIALAWAVGVAYAVLAIGTDVLVADVFRVEWGFITRITLWNIPIFAWSGLLLALAGRDYIHAYRAATGVDRARIRWFAVPLLIGSIAFIDYLPSLGVPVAPWGFVVLGVYMATAAWAVARYHLPDLTPAFAADQIVRTMAEPLLVCDDRSVIAFANPAAARLLGWPAHTLVGESLPQLFGAEAARVILEESHDDPVELEVMGRAGDPIAMAVSTSQIQAKGGQRVGTVVVARDIRERKRAAQEIMRREERFRALIEHARDTITILDDGGRIIYESPASHMILGYDPADSVGLMIFDRVHPDDADRIRDAFVRLLETPGGMVDGEGRIRSVEGEWRSFEFRATNLLEVPAVRGVVINARDVTEERQLGAQLQQAQKMEAIGQLAGGVAHDFNNILTAVLGNVALVLDELPEDSPFRGELEEIRRGADRAERLTDQLLSFSRRQVVRAEPLAANEVVGEMREMLGRLIGERIELSTRLEADPDAIRADRSQLEQAVVNLVMNARDAMHGSGRIVVGSRNVRVDEKAAHASEFQLAPGSYVLLTVQDDGKGMDAETRARIFEPFFTTKGPGEGTGLGLSTVYGSVRQASGYIGVQSRVGEGTLFSVYLPCLEEGAEPRARRSSATPARKTQAPAGAGEVVLVVEDEAPVRALIARVLERRGYRVLQAPEGREALEVAARHDGAIDLLVADLVMPGMSGREVADHLKALYPDMGIILISGYTADEVVRQGILTGEREFLPKPFTPDALIRRVAATLGAPRQPAR